MAGCARAGRARAGAACAVCAARTREAPKERQIHYEPLGFILCSHRGFIERFLPETTNRRLISRRSKPCHAQKMKIITAHGPSPLTRHQTDVIRALSPCEVEDDGEYHPDEDRRGQEQTSLGTTNVGLDDHRRSRGTGPVHSAGKECLTDPAAVRSCHIIQRWERYMHGPFEPLTWTLRRGRCARSAGTLPGARRPSSRQRGLPLGTR